MKKNDVILVVVVLILAGAVFGWSVLKKQEPGARVVVTVNKEETANYSLDEEGEYNISADNGQNTLIIKDGKADVTEADCPDKLCVKQKEISKNGETIVCLPHKVVVEIVSAESAEMDAISK